MANIWRNWNPCALLVGMQNGSVAMEKSMEVPQKLKIELLHKPAILTLGIYTKEFKSGSQNDICTPVFTEVLFTTVKIWKQPKCPLTDEWIKKMWYIDTMKYSSVLQRKSCHIQQCG